MGVLKRVRYEQVAQNLMLGKTHYKSCLAAGYKDNPSLRTHSSDIAIKKRFKIVSKNCKKSWLKNIC